MSGGLARMIAVRTGLGLLTLLLISVLIFGAMGLLPGDVAEAILGQNRTPETVAALRTQLGLDQPAWSRYLDWIGGMLTGDFGRSLASGRPVADLIGGRLVNTLSLAAYAALISVPLSIGLGILAALWRGRLADRGISIGALTAISMPDFFVAYVMIFLFAVTWGLLPSLAAVSPGAGLGEWLYRATLPALALTLATSAHMLRMTRASIVNVLASPYVEMAKLKGLTPSRVVVRHALPNALAPIINVVAVNLAFLIVGVVVVETVFVYPGLGQLLVDSVAARDVPVVQAACLIFAAAYVSLNLIADILAILTNPRLRTAR
ncbi:MAG: ABC transporter permease [Albimonas sp.]|uniref:ABC transporter permease n=1 Tax=Albimonas sp. TaxID=1872425 RepID=UPI004055BE0D|tara:strand:- start:12 stop:971 length:960 start_codon:yes stop_codon:yes gene_type:complete